MRENGKGLYSKDVLVSFCGSDPTNRSAAFTSFCVMHEQHTSQDSCVLLRMYLGTVGRQIAYKIWDSGWLESIKTTITATVQDVTR